MEYVTQSNPPGNDGQQLELFDTGQTLVEISVAALTTEPELRDIGRSLVALVHYHATKSPGPVQS